MAAQLPEAFTPGPTGWARRDSAITARAHKVALFLTSGCPKPLTITVPATSDPRTQQRLRPARVGGFYYSGSEWLLTGVISAVHTFMPGSRNLFNASMSSVSTTR